MSSLVEDDLVRASTFFALALVLTSIAGFFIGEFRLGIEIGLMLGAAFAVFAFFFIKPTAEDSDLAVSADDLDEPSGDSNDAETEPASGKKG